MTERLRKRQLATDTMAEPCAADEIDIAACTTIAFSSEDPAHPIENLLDERSGPGGTRWTSARPDTIERIVVEFDRPQTISRLDYEVRRDNTGPYAGGPRGSLGRFSPRETDPSHAREASTCSASFARHIFEPMPGSPLKRQRRQGVRLADGTVYASS
jgi:hypothetical protein